MISPAKKVAATGFTFPNIVIPERNPKKLKMDSKNPHKDSFFNLLMFKINWKTSLPADPAEKIKIFFFILK